MSEQAKFISGDGVEHEVSVDSYAFQLMSKDGSFTRIHPATAAEAKTVETKPNRAELLAKAKELGLTAVNNRSKTVDIIAAIAQAEADLAEPKEDDETETETGE